MFIRNVNTNQYFPLFTTLSLPVFRNKQSPEKQQVQVTTEKGAGKDDRDCACVAGSDFKHLKKFHEKQPT